MIYSMIKAIVSWYINQEDTYPEIKEDYSKK